MAAKLKSGDRVVVLAGRDEGKEGDILSVNPKASKAVVSGVNMVTRHQRQTQTAPGGRMQVEAPIQLSNIAIIDPKDGGPSRVGFRIEEGKKVRYAKKSGETIDG